jgi:hypothetical protein
MLAWNIAAIRTEFPWPRLFFPWNLIEPFLPAPTLKTHGEDHVCQISLASRASCSFCKGLVDIDLIRRLADASRLPLNVMVVDLLAVKALEEAARAAI